MKAVILAAGRGTRLKPYSDVLPKALMPIGISSSGALETIIEKLVRQIGNAGIEDIVVVVNYRAEQIMQTLGAHQSPTVRLSYVYQESLDGNAGAFYRAVHLIGESDVIVTDCDNDIADDDLFVKLTRTHRESEAVCTIAVSRVEDVTKFAIIKTNDNGVPIDIYEKPKDSGWGNLAKSGMMLFSHRLYGQGREVSRTQDGEFTTTQMIATCMAQQLPIALHEIAGGFHDIGTWPEYLPILAERLNAATKEHSE